MKPIESQQVCWFQVHEFVELWLGIVGDWPTLGTPAWCALDAKDPRKLAAVLDGGRHWALRLDSLQESLADASRDISAMADWSTFARKTVQRDAFYEARPWMHRQVVR